MPDLFDCQEPECPGLDVCPVRMCGCRWLAMGEAFKPSPEPSDDLHPASPEPMR